MNETATPTRDCAVIACDGRDEWLQERRKRIQATDAPCILGAAPESWGNALSVYASKVGVQTEDTPTVRQLFGLELEAPIMRIVERMHGGSATPWPAYAIAASIAYPHLGATPDGTYTTPERSTPGNLQIKTWREQSAAEWDDGPPLVYQVQVQHEMLVTGCEWTCIAVAFGFERIELYFVDRDEKFCELWAERSREFWQQHVEQNEPPSVDDNAIATARALAQLYPQDIGTATHLPFEATKLVGNIEHAKNFVKQGEMLIKGSENKLKEMLGHNAYGVLPDGRCVSWKTQSRKQHVVKASTFRVLRVNAKLPKGIDVVE